MAFTVDSFAESPRLLYVFGPFKEGEIALSC